MRLPRFPVLALCLGLGLRITAHAQVLERVDVDALGVPANGPAGSEGAISDDGRFVVFTSSATNLGGFGLPGFLGIYLRDRSTATTVPILSTLASGSAAFGRALISGDGTAVVYTRLFAPSTNHAFVHEISTGVTTEILVPGSPDVTARSVDAAGRYVVVLAKTSSVAMAQVYRVDLQAGATVLVSRNSVGTPVGGFDGHIDDSGTKVVFVSSSSQVVPNDTNGVADAFVLDIPSGSISRVSTATDGSEANDQVSSATISGNGRAVVFVTRASNLVFGDTSGSADVFAKDLVSGSTSRMSLTSDQLPMSGDAWGTPCISGDGARMSFASAAPVGPNDGGSSPDTYWRDVESGVLLPVSFGSPLPIDISQPLGLTQDGSDLLTSIVLTPTPLGAARSRGLFVARFGPKCSASGYCTSLPNSTGVPATINAQGDASRTLNSFVISAVGLPDTAISMIVSGTSAIDPGTTFGNGLLCVGGTLVRHGIFVADGGVVLDAQDLLSAEYAGVNPGDTRFYQVFYRDPPAGGALFNTTDAVAVTFCW